MTAAPAPMPPAPPRAPGARRPGRVPFSTPPAGPLCAVHCWSAWRERQEPRGKAIVRYCLDCPAEEHKRRR